MKFSSTNVAYVAIAAINFSIIIILYNLQWLLLFIFTANGLIIIGIIAFILYKLRLYIKGVRCTLPNRADGKVFLITGANSGIGFSLSKLLLQRGAEIHMLCRSRSRGNEAIKRLKQQGCNTSRVFLHTADLSNLESVKEFSMKFIREVGNLDVLVCNAGILGQMNYTETTDGYELTYQTNFLAHHLLTEKLLPILSGRIVNISSILHLYADTIGYSALDKKKSYGGISSYNRSKLAQVMVTKELTQSLNPGQSIVCCHPGNVYTNILQAGPLAFLEHTWVKLLIAYVLKSEEDGAQTPLHLCLDQNIVSGEYYRECRLDENVNPLVNNSAERRALLEQTRKMLKPLLC